MICAKVGLLMCIIKELLTGGSCLCRAKVQVFYYIAQPKPDMNNNHVKNINLNTT